MKRKWNCMFAVLLSIVMLASTACSGSKTPTTESNTTTTEKTTETATEKTETTTQETAAEPTTPDVNVADATDSSDLPDWTGKQLKLRVWNGHGTGDAIRYTSSNDVVSPEIKRLFGIELDAENSFDNGGQDLASKLAILAATNDFPEIGYNVINDDLIEGDKLYDLTDLLPKYCPNIYAFMQEYAPRTLAKGYNGTGKQYSIYMNVGNDADSIQTIYPDTDMGKYASISAPTDTQGSLSNLIVRDDILKLMYPNAKSQDEIEAMYVEKGSFTRDEVYDIPLTSRQEVIDFFYNMKKVIDENNITEGGKPVYPLGVSAGGDSWALLAWLRNQMDGKINFNYFTYFDAQTNELKLGFKQDWFKEDVRMFNQMVRDGVASEASLIENNEIYNDKLNNGEYAVSYAWLTPDAAKQAAANKPWKYRKVYIDIKQATDVIVTQRGEVKGYDQLSIFKDKIAEEDLPQLLSWLDFMYTDLGQKLVAWGPRSAGLWEEVNGVRRFTDKELEDNMVYNVANDASIKYNLASTRFDNTLCMAYPKMYVGFQGGGLNAPRYVYDLDSVERNPGGANNAFCTGIFEPIQKSKDVIVTSADIWSFTNEVEPVKRFWDVRGTGYETLLTKCLAAKSDADFEKAYQDMIDFAEMNGLDDAAVKECENLMKEKYPDDWNAYLAGY